MNLEHLQSQNTCKRKNCINKIFDNSTYVLKFTYLSYYMLSNNIHILYFSIILYDSCISIDMLFSRYFNLSITINLFGHDKFIVTYNLDFGLWGYPLTINYIKF